MRRRRRVTVEPPNIMYSPERLETPVDIPTEPTEELFDQLTDIDKAKLAILQGLQRSVTELSHEVHDIRQTQDDINTRLKALEDEREILMARMGGALWLARAIFVTMVGGAIAFFNDIKEMFQ